MTTTPPISSLERFAPATDAWRGPVALSPPRADQPDRIAYRALVGPGRYDVMLAPASAKGTATRRLAGKDDRIPVDLAFAPGSGWLACTSTSRTRRRRLHLLSLDDDRHEELEADAWAFKPDGSGLVLMRKGVLVERGLDGSERDRGPIEGDLDPFQPPELAVSPDSGRVAVLTHRKEENAGLIWILDDEGLRLLTDVPGWTARMRAAWSPDNRDLAVYIAHRNVRHSAVIVFYDGEGQGDGVLDTEIGEPIEGLCWAPSGRRIVTSRCEGRNPLRPRLAVIDLEGQRIVLNNPELPPPGRCRFDGDRLVVQAHDAAYRLVLDAERG